MILYKVVFFLLIFFAAFTVKFGGGGGGGERVPYFKIYSYLRTFSLLNYEIEFT